MPGRDVSTALHNIYVYKTLPRLICFIGLYHIVIYKNIFSATMYNRVLQIMPILRRFIYYYSLLWSCMYLRYLYPIPSSPEICLIYKRQEITFIEFFFQTQVLTHLLFYLQKNKKKINHLYRHTK